MERIITFSSLPGGIYHRKTKIGRRDIVNATEKQIGTVYFLHPAGLNSTRFFDIEDRNLLMYLFIVIGDTGEGVKGQVFAAMPNFSFPHLKVIFPSAHADMYTAWDGIVSSWMIC